MAKSHLFGSDKDGTGAVGDARSVAGRHQAVLLEHGLGKSGRFTVQVVRFYAVGKIQGKVVKDQGVE